MLAVRVPGRRAIDHLVCLMVAGLVGCLPGGPSQEGLSLRAGDSLLGRAPQGRIIALALSNLPEGLGEELGARVRTRAWAVAPEDWERVEGLPPFAAGRGTGQAEVYLSLIHI